MKPYYECSRFDKCNVNKCPLDPDIDLRTSIKTDEKCSMEKQIRFKIGKEYPNLLKYQGLTKSEWAGKQRWEALSDRERDAKRELVATRLSNWQKSKKTRLLEGVSNV